METKPGLKYLELFYFTGLLLRFLVSGRIYYWSNYLFLAWFSLAYFLALLATRSTFPIPRLLRLGLGLFFGGLILSMPFGIQPLYSGRELIVFLGYLFIFLSGLEILNPQNLKKLLPVIIFAALVQALYGFRQYFGGLENLVPFLGNTGLAQMEQISLKRIFGLTFSPDFFSGFLAASLILLFGCAGKWLRQNPGKKMLRTFLIALLVILLLASLLLSKSLGGGLSLLIGSSAFVILKSSQTRFSKKNLSILLALVLFAAAVFSLFLYHRRQLIFQRQNNPVILRLYNFQAGFKVYLERPVSGVGLGNFWIAYPKYRQPQSNEVRYAHNNFIQVLAEAGPIAEAGLVFLIIYLLLGLGKIRAKDDDYLTGIFCALLALASHWLWDFGLFVPELASIFWVLLAGFAVKLNTDSPKKFSRLTLVSLGLLVLILLSISGWLFAEQRMVKSAEAYYKLRSLDPAEKYARQALKILPADDYAYALLAFSASGKRGKEELVAGYFRKAVSLNPRFAFWHKDLADYYFKQGKINSAELEYLRALELYPNSIELLSRLARSRRLQGDLSNAEKYAQAALAISGDQRHALWELLKIKRAKGEREEALKILKELSDNYQDPEAKKLFERYTKEQNR